MMTLGPASVLVPLRAYLPILHPDGLEGRSIGDAGNFADVIPLVTVYSTPFGLRYEGTTSFIETSSSKPSPMSWVRSTL